METFQDNNQSFTIELECNDSMEAFAVQQMDTSCGFLKQKVT